MKAKHRLNDPDINELQNEIGLIELDPDFSRLVNGKKIIIVGPAETIRGTSQGKLIDAHDLVVRFNTAIQYMPFDSNLANDIGTRTDILYCNNEVLIQQIVQQEGISHDKFKQVCEVTGMRYLVSTNNPFTYTVESESNSRSEHLAFSLFLQQQRIGMGFRMLYSTSASARRLLDGYVGRTGFLAILDLLSYDIESLSITGMTFYHGGGHLFFEDCVDELHPMKNHLGREPPESVKGHNSYLELELMKKLAQLFGRKLKLDEHVQKLMDACAATSGLK